MKRSNRLSILAALLSLCFANLACDDLNIRMPLFEIKPDNTLTGHVTGTANSIWVFDNRKIDCPDPAAEYQLDIAADSKLPADTHITSKIGNNLHYFRLEAVAVMNMLQDYQCLIGDPSNDRYSVIIEGSFDSSSSQFKVLSCDTFGPPSSAEMYFTSEFIVSADITCSRSDQSLWAFHFSGLELK